MIVAIGSKNPAKVKAITALQHDHPGMIDEVIPVSASSGVSDQPMSDEETRLGAINRAAASLQADETAGAGIGLEGGVMAIGDELYLSNWGALAYYDRDHTVRTVTASGARIALPAALADELKNGGQELGDIIDAYAEKENVRKTNGTIGILTADWVTRDSMFYHIGELLLGQWQQRQR